MQTFTITYLANGEHHSEKISARDIDAAQAKFMHERKEQGMWQNIVRVDRWFHDTLEIRQANIANGYHWFDDDTLRFFHSRVHDAIYGGRYFVSSERNPSGIRAYTVREAHTNGNVDTAEGHKFMQYASRSAAHAAASRLANA